VIRNLGDKPVLESGMPRLLFLFYTLFVSAVRMQSGTRNRLRQSAISRHRKFATAEL
jgi:hypothetical protein